MTALKAHQTILSFLYTRFNLPQGEFGDQAGGRLRQGHRAVVGVALAHVPAPQNLLVHALRLLHGQRQQ